MPAIEVPELKRKFALLRAYSARSDWHSLAQAFAAAPKTLQYWAQGSAVRLPDRVPERAVPILARLFADLLPEHRSEDDVRRLVFGPAARLEEEIRAGTSALFAELIAREGRHGRATLIRREDVGGLVEIEEERSSRDLPRLAPDAYFRIEFAPLPMGQYTLALQHAQRRWAVLPSARHDDVPAAIFVPGHAGGQPLYMRERNDIGVHRFVCVQAAAPFPASLDERRREQTVLDKRGLEELATFYWTLAASNRACLLLDVLIEPRP